MIRCVIYGPLFVVIGGLLFCHSATMTRPPQCDRLFRGKFSVSYDAAKPDATSGKLNFDELDIVELIIQIEETFFVSISNEEFTSLGGEDG